MEHGHRDGASPTPFVILDDAHGASFAEAGVVDRWVETRVSTGLTHADALRALELLRTPRTPH